MRSLRQVALLLLVTAARGLEVPPSDSSAGPSEPAEPPLVSLQSQLDEMLSKQLSNPATEPPTVVLAGHHNDGKSALLEALLGLRLSHVGASTTTRRPLRVHSQHDSACEEPVLFLQRDGPESAEERVSLADVRAYVEAENSRLQRLGEVEDADIRVRLRWRLAPNVVLIDTPGLLSLPAGSSAADASLLRTSTAAERVLLAQLSAHPARLCLCLEDTADWQLSPTRDVVCRADPRLERTLLVSTKLDGKLRMFSKAEDLHRLLNPTSLTVAHPKLLGGPIFTSIPPVRDASSERNPAALAEAVAKEEASMRKLLHERLGSDEYASRIGIHALRSEMQPLIDKRWAEIAGAASQAVDAKLANLQRSLRAPPEVESEDLEDFVHRFCLSVHALLKGSMTLRASEHGETLQQEQANSGSGPLCQLKKPAAADRKAASEGATTSSSWTSSSSSSSAAAAAAASRPASGGAAGSTRIDFNLKSGGGGEALDAAALATAAEAATAGDNPTRDEALLWLHASKRLYGGAQYWRALQEFMLGAAQAPEEEVTVEEIVNAMGVDGYHDGVNYMRAVCVIVVEKARGYFDEALAKLRKRMLHVMARLCVLADELMLIEAERARDAEAHSALAEAGDADAAGAGGGGAATTLHAPGRQWGSLSGFDGVRPASPAAHAQYMSAVAPVFRKFVTRTMASTMDKCVHDVSAMTRYVSWDFSSPTKDALHNLLVEPVHVALENRFAAAAAAREEAAKRYGRNGGRRGRGGGRRGRGEGAAEEEDEALDGAAEAARTIASYEEMVAGFTETLMTRRVTEPMRQLMNELVVEVIRAWREEFCRTISVKLNSGFLLPFCEALPNYMRKEVGRYAREMGMVGLDGDGASPGGVGIRAGGLAAAGMGTDARTSRLRIEIDEGVRQRESLQRITHRMHARVVKGSSQ